MEPETAHMIQTLRTVMRVLGFRNADLERKLGLSTSYLSRLFSGGIELRFEHIVTLAEAMGVRPAEIFRFAYPETGEPPSEAAQRLRLSTGGFQPPVHPPESRPLSVTPPSEADLERLMARTLRRFFGEMAQLDERGNR
ncbi:MAG TPA: helix-turn-helix transcriptional regulator [Thermoanaerobaculia bacterium]|nr:helix-turn-helix transcriptional regulator [Thermoanaerobaculia bacterium]